MGAVLDGVVVVEVASGQVSSLTAMLLGDYGARVVKVEPPGGDPLRVGPGPLVWDRSKERVELDLAAEDGAASLRRLAAGADVLVEAFAPSEAARLGLDLAALRAANPRLITCSITGYGPTGDWADRPAIDALVAARIGIQSEQPALDRDGPVHLHSQLPTYGAFYLASCGINAALRAREVTGQGQHVDTSLAQGALLWTTMVWTRAEQAAPDLTVLFKHKTQGPTPTFPTADGWMHAMPQAVPVAAAHLGIDDPDLNAMFSMGTRDERARFYAAASRMFTQRPRQEWLDLLWASDVSAQPCLPPGGAHHHPQVEHNRVVTDVEVPDHGTVRQLGHPYHLSLDEEMAPTAPAAVGEHTAAVLASPPTGSPARPDAAGELPPYAMAGVRVLDYGIALAGPFGPMIMGELGADIVKVDNITPAVGTNGGIVWAACQRGKRSIAIDLKSPEGQEISRRLIASADVVHYNMRVGVAERLGFGYEQAKAVNPSIVHCHVTGYGNTGPLATWPGVDQMGQALSGIEWEQGGSFGGGHPQWSRFGMCDAATGLLSVIGVLQALYHRERTGEGQQVETNIINAGMVFASDAVTGDGPLPERAHLDRAQTGLGPLHRLYETADGWLYVVARDEAEWRALAGAVGRSELAEDVRFADGDARRANAEDLAAMLAAAFATKSAADWFGVLDAVGVPCEVSVENQPDDRTSGGQSPALFDDPVARANGWVSTFDHPTWGALDQPGRLLALSATPAREPGRPPMVGEHTREVLVELGYNDSEIDALRAKGVVAW